MRAKAIIVKGVEYHESKGLDGKFYIGWDTTKRYTVSNGMNTVRKYANYLKRTMTPYSTFNIEIDG
jgi:hypothetical protein